MRWREQFEKFSLKDDRTDTNFIALLKMYFQRSISTLDSLKRVYVFNLLRRKPSLGAPEESACLTFRAKRKQNLSSYFFFFISFLVCVCVFLFHSQLLITEN